MLAYDTYIVHESILTLGAYAGAARVTLLVLCVCACVCAPVGANLRTGASRRRTEDTSDLSGTFYTEI